MDFTALADDIRAEAAQYQFLTGQIDRVDARIAALVDERDPDGILQSAPGVGPVVAGIIAGRIGDPHRFTRLSAVRKFAGVPTSYGTRAAPWRQQPQVRTRFGSWVRWGSNPWATVRRQTGTRLPTNRESGHSPG